MTDYENPVLRMQRRAEGVLEGIRAVVGERPHELDIQAGAFTEALIRHGHVELAEDFVAWYYENREEWEE